MGNKELSFITEILSNAYARGAALDQPNTREEAKRIHAMFYPDNVERIESERVVWDRSGDIVYPTFGPDFEVDDLPEMGRMKMTLEIPKEK